MLVVHLLLFWTAVHESVDHIAAVDEHRLYNLAYFLYEIAGIDVNCLGTSATAGNGIQEDDVYFRRHSHLDLHTVQHKIQ